MYEFEAGKLLEIEVRPNKRYRVQSRSDPDVKHLVKWSATEGYSCSCPWGTHRAKEKDCEHVHQVRERFGKACNLCSKKGEHEKSLIAPWKHQGNEVTLYLCDGCDQFLDSAYRRGVSK